MSEQIINIEEIEKQLSDLLDIVSNGDEVVIAQNGKPPARLEAIEPKKKKRVAGLETSD